MSFSNWDEIRTAYQVARLGTVSGAAEVLGVHHATVIRHIDALEGRLGVKLFQRHARGYTATEAGSELLKVAAATDDQFSQLIGRIKGQGGGVTGELVVTSVVGVAALLTPVLARFQAEHEGLTIRYLTDSRLFRLEYGEAHVAIRAGSFPQEPDNVVQPLQGYAPRLAASQGYAKRHGLPASPAEFTGHRFISADAELTRAPQFRWLADQVPAEAIVFRATEPLAMESAVLQGAGIGFVPASLLAGSPDLVEVMAPDPAWQSQLWLVTHVDLHRTAKVQAFLQFLKEEAKAWQ
ncbi:MAG: LysR family transcriptional regulator [Paracoccaceae bacterium]